MCVYTIPPPLCGVTRVTFLCCWDSQPESRDQICLLMGVEIRFFCYCESRDEIRFVRWWETGYGSDLWITVKSFKPKCSKFSGSSGKELRREWVLQSEQRVTDHRKLSYKATRLQRVTDHSELSYKVTRLQRPTNRFQLRGNSHYTTADSLHMT